MTVNPLLPVSVTASPSVNPVCAGTPVTFTAVPVNGGVLPVFQWKVNGLNSGTNSTAYTYVPANGDIVRVVLNSSALCPTGNPATSGPVTMAVNPLLPVGITISANQNPICAGTTVTLTANATNGGGSPVYQWKLNGVNAGSGSPVFSLTPLNGDVVTCVLTSDAVCPTGNPATAAPVTFVVNPVLPVSISVSASSDKVCQGTPVTFTATTINGGSLPVYQWKVNGGNTGPNAPVYTYFPSPGDIITCGINSNVVCPSGNPASSAPFHITVYPLPAVVANASDTAVCAGSPVTLTGSGAHTYSWDHGVVDGISFIPTGTATYSVTGIDTNGSINTAHVRVLVNPLPPIDFT